MTNARFDKSKLPSRHVTEGPARAPHRSYFYAMGITEEEIHQPWVGVATCWNEAAPCNIALNRQAQVVKQGVKKGGGTPREFTTITVTDGIAMGIGFTIALTGIGAIREIVGSGTLFADASLLLGPAFKFMEMRLLPETSNVLVMILPPGGFLVFGLLMSVNNAIKRSMNKREALAAKQVTEQQKAKENA